MRRRAAKPSKNRFLRIITLPFRVLGMAGDAYARGLTRCTTGRRVPHAAEPEGHLPRSFTSVSHKSRGSNDIANATEDFRELFRAASAKSLGIDVLVAARAVPKSCSVAMRRIDEDEPCEFGDDEDVKRKSEKPSRRSRSYAVRNTGK